MINQDIIHGTFIRYGIKCRQAELAAVEKCFQETQLDDMQQIVLMEEFARETFKGFIAIKLENCESAEQTETEKK